MHMHTHSNSAKGAYTCTDRRMQNVFTIERNCRYAHAPHNAYAADRRDTYIGWVHCSSDNSIPCNCRPKACMEFYTTTTESQMQHTTQIKMLRMLASHTCTNDAPRHFVDSARGCAAVRLACAARVCEWARHWTPTGRCCAGRAHVQD